MKTTYNNDITLKPNAIIGQPQPIGPICKPVKPSNPYDESLPQSKRVRHQLPQMKEPINQNKNLFDMPYQHAHFNNSEQALQ